MEGNLHIRMCSSRKFFSELVVPCMILSCKSSLYSVAPTHPHSLTKKPITDFLQKQKFPPLEWCFPHLHLDRLGVELL